MLKKCLIGKIIQCHIDYSDPDSFVVGRLVHFNNDWFIMQDISSAGCWNGLALYMQSDIVSVNEFTDYICRIVSLIKCRNEPEQFIPPLSDDPLISILIYARDSMRVVGIELHKSGYRDINGTIECLTSNTICINQIDEFGRADGKSYISIDAITRCFMDDEESKCLEMLMQYESKAIDQPTVQLENN